jgi:hypothetical protein
LLTEAGGHVAHWNGAPYRVWDEQSGLLAAGNAQLWNDVERALFTNAAVHEARLRRQVWAEHGPARDAPG